MSPRFEPDAIFHFAQPQPDGNQARHKTSLNLTIRDWGQSNTGWLHPDHAKELLQSAKAYYAATGNKGTVEIGGGTFPRRQLVEAGENPYEYIRKMREAAGPDVHLMALVRSNAGPAMEDLPADVVKDYVKRYVEAGVDVIRNFHSHNDPRQFKNVFDATKEAGAHFQAAYAWTVFENDPTVYNPKAVVDFFKDLEKEDVHPDSYVLKDPAGVLSPAMAKLITKEMKKAFPKKPFGIHTHDQCGYAAASCLAAAQAGADFVDVSPGPGGRAAQAPIAPMLRMLEDANIDVGFGDDASARARALSALRDVDAKAERIAPIYQKAAAEKKAMSAEALNTLIASYINTTYGTSIEVEQHGVAGGQARDAQDRLAKLGRAHQYAGIKQELPNVRAKSGGIVLVTPAANNNLQEAMRRVHEQEMRSQGVWKKDVNSSLADEIIKELTGEAGPAPVEIDPQWQRLALRIRADKKLKEIAPDKVQALTESGAIDTLVTQMQRLYAPVHDEERLKVVNARIRQLESIVSDARDGDTDYRNYLSELDRKIARSGMTAIDGKTRLHNVSDVIANLHAEAKKLNARPRHEELRKEYEAMQKGAPSVAMLESIKRGNNAFDSAGLSDEQIAALMRAAGVTTVIVSEMLPPGLEKAKKELQTLLDGKKLPVAVSSRMQDEDASIMAMFGDGSKGKSVAEDYFEKRGSRLSYKHPEPSVASNGHNLAAGVYFLFKNGLSDAGKLKATILDKLTTSDLDSRTVNIVESGHHEDGDMYKIEIKCPPGYDATKDLPKIKEVVASFGGALVGHRDLQEVLKRDDWRARQTQEANTSWMKRG